MTRLLLIAAGGAVGSVLRYLLSGWVQVLTGTGAAASRSVFPWGTLSVNAIGCLAIGFLNALFAARLVAPQYRAAVLIGVLGGFTTFSSYAWESLALANDGQAAQAGVNLVLTNALCLALVWTGYRAGVWMFGAA